MNELIKSIAKKAEAAADEATNPFNDDSGAWQHTWNEVYDQKFAELIVAECANIMLHYSNVEEAVKVMKKHFGQGF